MPGVRRVSACGPANRMLSLAVGRATLEGVVPSGGRMPGTLIGIFLETVARHRKPAQFMRRIEGRWESIAAERALGEVERLAMGLSDLGVGPGDAVALLAETR